MLYLSDVTSQKASLTVAEELESFRLSVKICCADQAPDEDLRACQIRLAELNERVVANTPPRARRSRRKGGPVIDLPERWDMLGNRRLFAWQEECVSKWLQQNGTVKVVTGAGKTVLALAIMQQLQAQHRELRAAIVVPSIVLMEQWYEEIVRNSNLPEESVGRLGGGYSDSFAHGVRVLICVLKSAADKLEPLVEAAGIADDLLLVVDECHRAGSAEMSKVFRTKRKYNLGLSATPERDDPSAADDDATPAQIDYNLSLLGQALGPIIYNMTLNNADEMGLLPNFTVYHYGVPLSPEEKEKYENLSSEIHKLQDELRGSHDARSTKTSFFLQCQALARQEGPLARTAMRFIKLTADRKRVLYGAMNRRNAVLALIEHRLLAKPDARIIVFHESIEEVMSIYRDVAQATVNGIVIPAVVEHSRLPRNVRDEGIRLFRDGSAKVMVSARSLVEGFNVPRADVGIIAASSTSVRQRIQTLGRVLRRPIDGGDKQSEVHVVYCRGTTDESIYRKADWGQLTGVERNEYYLWDVASPRLPQHGPPVAPLPTEADIDPAKLVIGQEYPGEYEGAEYTCRSDGNVYSADNVMATHPQGIPELIKSFKGSFGRFKVTLHKRYILILRPLRDEDGDQAWETIYVGTLAEPFAFVTDNYSSPSTYAVGEEYPHGLVGKNVQELTFRKVQGRLAIMVASPRGSLIARGEDRAEDKNKGREHDELLIKIQGLAAKGHKIWKLFVTERNDVVFADAGCYRYITSLMHGIELPTRRGD